jgi:hypothetical protein
MKMSFQACINCLYPCPYSCFAFPIINILSWIFILLLVLFQGGTLVKYVDKPLMNNLCGSYHRISL